MSDSKLRELERLWRSGEASDDEAVAYLAELVRTGKVTSNECVLAWRLGRMETLLKGHRGTVTNMGNGLFKPDVPSMARDVLRILFGPVTELSNLHLVGDAGPEGASVSMRMIQDSVRGILSGQRYDPAFGGRPLGRGPAFHLLECQPEAHLGPINYEGTAPICERCNASLMIEPAEAAGRWAAARGGVTVRTATPAEQQSALQDAIARCSECGCGVVSGLQEHYDGCSRK